jgi:hypothetical protein
METNSRVRNLRCAYVDGEEPEDDASTLDFGEWASVYRTWLARQAGCHHLAGI